MTEVRDLKELKSGGYVDIAANRMAGNIPPISCLVDGIQISTGCTMGKGNIFSISHGAVAIP